jgi:hypothetical protein
MNRFRVMAAAALVLVLTVTLGVRISARTGRGEIGPGSRGLEAPAAGYVPEPVPIVVSEIPTPFCWGCSTNRTAPLEFQVDLDLLAPLGEGPENAAAWLSRFAKGEPRHASDGKSVYSERLVEMTIDGDEWRVFPAADPLLLEAEAWVDQARCSFYPDVWEPAGVETPIPDLLLTLHFSRSWIARGKLADDPQRAREDFRRAIRLGRLLRQDDVTIIQDLVAIANIRLGAEALYDLARREGDAATMLVTALVLADKDAMRQQTARWLTTFERSFRPSGFSDDELESIIDLLGEMSSRRFRMEGLISLQLARHMGTDEQRTRATEVLDEYTRSGDDLLAEAARQFRDTTLEGDALKSLLEVLGL